VSYRKESLTEAVAIATTGGVDLSRSCLQQLQHPSLWSLRLKVFVFATGRLLELYMCIRQQFMSTSNLEMIGYAM